MSLTIFRIASERREEIRKAMVIVLGEGRDLSVRRVREHCGGRSDSIGVLLRAVRSGLLDLSYRWDGLVPELDLAVSIRSISSHADRTRIHQEIAAQIAAGTLTPKVAKALQESLSAARLSAKAAQDQLGVASAAEPVYVVDDLTFLVAKVVNRIVSPEILDEVVRFTKEAAERDLREFPNPTLAEVEQLRSQSTRHAGTQGL